MKQINLYTDLVVSLFDVGTIFFLPTDKKNNLCTPQSVAVKIIEEPKIAALLGNQN